MIPVPKVTALNGYEQGGFELHFWCKNREVVLEFKPAKYSGGSPEYPWLLVECRHSEDGLESSGRTLPFHRVPADPDKRFEFSKTRMASADKLADLLAWLDYGPGLWVERNKRCAKCGSIHFEDTNESEKEDGAKNEIR